MQQEIDAICSLQHLVDENINNVNAIDGSACPDCAGQLNNIRNIVNTNQLLILQLNVMANHRGYQKCRKINVRLSSTEKDRCIMIDKQQFFISSIIHHHGETVHSGHYTNTVYVNNNQCKHITG